MEENQATTKKGMTPAQHHKFWQKEITAARKRTSNYRTQGNRVVDRYLDDRGLRHEERGPELGSRLNLFHKNTNTLMNMLYGQTPRVDVSREHQDPDDDAARVASVIIQRLLEADYQPSGEDISCVLKAALKDRLLPGMGQARLRYEAITATSMSIDEFGNEVEVKRVENEEAKVEYVHWQDLLWGWGRTWNEIPWWGFRAWLTKDEVTKRFGEKVASNLEYQNQLPTGSKGDKDYDSFETEQRNNVQKAEIWEIWQKSDKKVYWFSEGADLILDVRDDPLGLDGFWPMPKPMIANTSTSLFLPRADFVINQDLYNEVDILQTRISIITNAVKVVGVYDKAAGGSVGRMLKEGVENDLIPVDNWAMFAEKGGLQGQIDWFPVQEVVGVLDTLVQVQQNKIVQLNEVTGMSEIMRGGAGGQYTAAASNEIAAKMGSIDVQAMQDEFARFASDLEALKAEVVGKLFEPTTILKQSNAMFLPMADKQLIQPALQLIKSPEVKWRINIRPESIAMVDYAQLKSERTEFLTAMATYLQSAQAVVQHVPGSLPILLEMLKWGMAGFKGSDYLEGTMDRAIDMAKQAEQQQQGQKQPSPEQLKLEAEKMKLQGQQMKQQGELQKIQAKAAADMASLQAKLQGEIQKIMVDAKRDQTLEQMQSQNRLIEIAKELESDIAQIRANLNADLTVERAQAQYDIAEQDNAHQNNLIEINAQRRNDAVSE
jgi:hypothetical protein